MQALRRRTVLAINQVKRRQKKHNEKETAVLRYLRIYKATRRNKVQLQNWRHSQQEVREKWRLGELQSTPGYLEGLKDDVPQEYAPSKFEKIQERKMDALQERLRKSGEALLLEREEKRKNPEYNVVKGDRIVVRATEGPCARYRGEIGTVVGVNRQRKVCVVEGMTIRQARAPKAAPLYTLFSEPHIDPEHHVLLPIPFSHMRIVKTVVNGYGEKEDVVLGRLSPQDLSHMGRPLEAEEMLNRRIESPRQAATRTAPDGRRAQKAAADAEPDNEDTKLAREQSNPDSTIHDPSKKKQGPLTKLFNRITGRKPKEEKKDDTPDDPDALKSPDTSRLDRDNATWTPTLLRAPLPATVIDELRGKYSKFRTRHDADFLRRMQQIDSAKLNYQRWAKSGAGVLHTPRREAWLREQARRKEERRALGKQGPLDKKVLEGIGRVMWERGMRLNPKGEIEARRMAEKAERRKLSLQGESVVDAVANQAAEGERGRDTSVEEAK